MYFLTGKRIVCVFYYAAFFDEKKYLILIRRIFAAQSNCHNNIAKKTNRISSETIYPSPTRFPVSSS
jgi:hypothetical protein